MNLITNKQLESAARASRFNTLALTACSLLAAASTAQAYYLDPIYGEASKNGDWYGAAFVEVGDLNNDSFNDYAVGSPGWSYGKGRVEVVSGKSIVEVDNGTRQSYVVIWSKNGMASGDRFGAAIASQKVGTTRRIMVGAPGANGNRGYVQVLTSTGGVQRTILGASTGEQFGFSISVCANLGGDSAMDWAIGCPGGDGKVKIYADGTFAKIGEQPGHSNMNGNFGYAIDGTTDFTGDGVPDLLIGEPGYMNQRGGACVLSGADMREVWSMMGRVDGDRFGAAVSAAGDISRGGDINQKDGNSEILIGIPDADVSTYVDCGAVMVFDLTKANPLSPVHYFRGWYDNEHFGFSVSGGGYYNSDNLVDYVVGAPGAGANGPNTGAFYVFNANKQRLIRMDGQDAGGTLGFHVAFADIDDDGTDEILLGKAGGGIVTGDMNGTGIPGALRIWSRFELTLPTTQTYYTWPYYSWSWGW